ncbi:MAG TPA: hypothetical protein VFP68_17930, partial [Burkholderiaceae bacterium]|nr:hypothetical protein [Burkholderiaceae bacterium]
PYRPVLPLDIDGVDPAAMCDVDCREDNPPVAASDRSDALALDGAVPTVPVRPDWLWLPAALDEALDAPSPIRELLPLSDKMLSSGQVCPAELEPVCLS